MAITWAQVVVLAPNLASASTDFQTEILAQVAAQMSVPDWNASRFDIAAKYLAAYLGTMILAGPSGPSGPIIEKHVGPIGASYAAPLMSLDALMSNSFGREFMRLRRMNSSRIGLVA